MPLRGQSLWGSGNFPVIKYICMNLFMEKVEIITVQFVAKECTVPFSVAVA